MIIVDRQPRRPPLCIASLSLLAKREIADRLAPLLIREANCDFMAAELESVGGAARGREMAAGRQAGSLPVSRRAVWV